MSPGHWDEEDSLVGHSFLPPAVIQGTYGFWNLQIIIWIEYWIWYTTLVSPWSLPQASWSDELHLSHSTTTFHGAKNHHGKQFRYHIASQSDGHPVTLILRNSSRYLWGTINVYFQSIILFSGQWAVFYGLLNRIWIPHQMLVVWATAMAPGKLPKMWPSSKHSKLNYIPLKNSLGLVRHTQAFYAGSLSFTPKMEIMISPRCVGTRKALSIWNKMKTI